MCAAVIGSALLVVNGVAIAAPDTVSIEFTCPFPFIGDQIITANISADYPEAVVIGAEGVPVELPPVYIDAIAIVPDQARQGLDFAGATTVTGVAYSVNNFHTVVGDLPHNIDLDIEPTTVPVGETGPFEVPANGYSPVQSFGLSHIGAVTLTVDDLVLDLKNLRTDGSVATAPIGVVKVDCELNEGQDNLLSTIQVTSVLAEAEIEVEQTAIDLGANLLGQSSAATVTIKNIGGAILGINAVSILGEDAHAFSEANNCTTLDVGESCTATVTYTASAEGAQNASLVINSTDVDEPSVSVVLSGTGVIDDKPEITIDVTLLDFGTIEESARVTQTILIENVGAATLTISGVVVNNTQGSEFSVTENCFSIAAGASCSETVTFDAVEGDSVGFVVISSDDDDESEVVIDLSGAGKEKVLPFCEQFPNHDDCNVKINIKLDVEGSSYIAANGGTISLKGEIVSQFNLTQGSFTGDLNLKPTKGSFEIVRGWSRYQATAKIEFESVGDTVGSLVDGRLVATSQAYIKLPKVTKTLFGLADWNIGGGDECRTKEPVMFTITSAEGEYFDALSGGVATGTYMMPELENCGLLTSIISSKLAGSGNTISLTLTPNF